jgi:hypothetical protein
MPGLLAAGLQLRRARGLAPLTLMSCDNLPGNGRKLRSAVARIARAHDRALADWIAGSCAFPATMVDRIVPAATEADLAAAASRLRLSDCAAVRTECFSQWVIEDRFAGPVPEFERGGAQLTNDVALWEQAKLRLLNGAHSAMAYLGGLAGIDTVDAFIAVGHAVRRDTVGRNRPDAVALAATGRAGVQAGPDAAFFQFCTAPPAAADRRRRVAEDPAALACAGRRAPGGRPPGPLHRACRCRLDALASRP